MKLNDWVLKLPQCLKITLGIMVALICWPLIIIILLISNILISFKQFHEYFLGDIRQESKVFIEFFKSLIRKNNETTH